MKSNWERKDKERGKQLVGWMGITYSLKKYLEILARFFTLPLEIPKNCV